MEGATTQGSLVYQNNNEESNHRSLPKEKREERTRWKDKQYSAALLLDLLFL